MPVAIKTSDFEIGAALINASVVNSLQVRIAEAIAAERERCALVAEHLNGWGSAPRGRERAAELAAHIARAIREG